jgi:hypothetical protein
MSIDDARAALENALRRLGESLRNEGLERRTITPRAEILDLIVLPHVKALMTLVRGHESEKNAKCYLVEVLSVAAGAKGTAGHNLDVRTEADGTEVVLRKLALIERLSIRASPAQASVLSELAGKEGPWIALMTFEEIKAKWDSDPISLVNSSFELREHTKAVSFNVAKDWKNNQLKAFFRTN